MIVMLRQSWISDQMDRRAELFRGANLSPLTDNRMDLLMKENDSIRKSKQGIDDAMELGIATQEKMLQQRAYMVGATSRLQSVIEQVPLVGTLAGKIEVKRQRDRLILGGLIGFLMFVIVWYLFG